MDVGEWTANDEWSATPEPNKICREIHALGLEGPFAELEAFEFTVIRDALSPALTRGLRQAVLDSAETSIDKKLDLQQERSDLHNVRLAPFNRFNAWRNEGPNMHDLRTMRAARNWQS